MLQPRGCFQHICMVGGIGSGQHNNHAGVPVHPGPKCAEDRERLHAEDMIPSSGCRWACGGTVCD